ncbi:hypothetical protein Ddye_029730 [Dipteronia dyeriana]|uniref:Protein FAR1-RELATED SEQUENCE n=1 Tax=Dipteronia dyeriana TaxID=168575 RepID=A0AAD9WM40_9ROSI|nr:hypothetical protein Ddye_029730 [Dipteronia dyeriana]
MSGRAPNGIITDQDKAMKKVIQIVFPNTRHRLCLWHIMNKVPKWLCGYKECKSISFSLNNTVYDSLTPNEFEEGWTEMIEKYKVRCDWLESIYSERYHWVSAYIWKTVSGQFIDQYEKALKKKVENETMEDCNCLSSRIPCVTRFDMEKQVERVYTISKFKEFQAELIGKLICNMLSMKKMDDETLQYQISDFVMIEEIKKKFRGILYRHAVYVLTHREMDLVPTKYISQRWRKDVKRYRMRIKVNYDERTPEAHMQKCFDEIKEATSSYEDKCMLVMTWIQPMANSLVDNKCENFANGVSNSSQCIPTPLKVRSIGRPPSKRKQSEVEQVRRTKQQRDKKIMSDEFLTPGGNYVSKDSIIDKEDQVCMAIGQQPISFSW